MKFVVSLKERSLFFFVMKRKELDVGGHKGDILSLKIGELY